MSATSVTQTTATADVLTGPATRSRTENHPAAANATHDLLRYAALLGQLLLVLMVFRVFRVEDARFMRMVALAFGAFAIHYWVPFRYKEWFWILTSVAGSFVLLDPVSASLLLVVGATVFAIVSAPVSFPLRISAILALFAGLVWGRMALPGGIPPQFWPVLGAIFMFRLIVYLYDLAHATRQPSGREYLAYFFMLPNYYFLLFPVIDFQTQRKTFYRRDIHEIAQQGIDWIFRGTLQLLLYRLIYSYRPATTPEAITSFGALAAWMLMTYLLYLRVSGQFHIIVGLLHLFGYDLPETHRRYLLARSLTDFWRRINIYWKDFMVKVVYFPVYFRLRRQGDLRAQLAGTLAVFVVTWALHSYQWFWLRGEWLFTWPDTLFWAILGGLMLVNVTLEHRKRGRGLPAGWRTQAATALQVAGTFLFITVLWSFWSAASVDQWTDIVTWWQVG